MRLYRTVRRDASAELIIEKSRFIARITPASCREEAEAFFGEVKKEHRGATHNVPAMILGNKGELQWASDDGEPQGTSGLPVLQMLAAEGLTNVAAMVTRYFGGVKLGTGGLVRAYAAAAKAALEAAGRAEAVLTATLTVTLEYTYLNRLQNEAGKGLFSIGEIRYADRITLEMITEPEKEEAVRTLLQDLTGGTAEVLRRDEAVRLLPELPKEEIR